MIIDWALDKHIIHIVDLENWLVRVKALVSHFRVLTFQHIYREYNMVADDLSKKAMGIGTGMIFWEEFKEEFLMESGSLKLY